MFVDFYGRLFGLVQRALLISLMVYTLSPLLHQSFEHLTNMNEIKGPHKTLLMKKKQLVLLERNGFLVTMVWNGREFLSEMEMAFRT
jgi:hypothetical protein